MRRFGLPVLPLIIGVILGPPLEAQMTEALAISQGDLSTLWGEPVAVVVYVVMAVLLVALVLSGSAPEDAEPTPTPAPVKEEVSHDDRGRLQP